MCIVRHCFRNAAIVSQTGISGWVVTGSPRSILLVITSTDNRASLERVGHFRVLGLNASSSVQSSRADHTSVALLLSILLLPSTSPLPPPLSSPLQIQAPNANHSEKKKLLVCAFLTRNNTMTCHLHPYSDRHETRAK